jgi:hypothetical protein
MSPRRTLFDAAATAAAVAAANTCLAVSGQQSSSFEKNVTKTGIRQ